MKNAAIRIRLEKELHKSFTAACKAEHRQASDVLREFMRLYADQHNDGKQGSLFTGDVRERGIGSAKNA